MLKRQVQAASVFLLLLISMNSTIYVQAQAQAKVSDWSTPKIEIERGTRTGIPWNVSFRNGGNDNMRDTELRITFTDLNITPMTVVLGGVAPGESKVVKLNVAAPVLRYGGAIGEHVVLFELHYRDSRGPVKEDLMGTIDVTPMRTKLTLAVGNTRINVNEPIDLTGTLLDANGDSIWNVLLDFYAGGKYLGQSHTTQFGISVYRWIPNATGTYKVYVRHEGMPSGGYYYVPGQVGGEKYYVPNQSNEVTVTVEKKGGPCIIATTTFGSELDPTVQFLRGFRDRDALSTFAGSQFMAAFNIFYYSFSPSVASFIVQGDSLRTMMKAILYPLIGALQVASLTFYAFDFAPEFGIFLAGFVASFLLGIVYLSPMAILIGWRSRRAAQSVTWVLRILGCAWISSIPILLIAEIMVSEVLMTVGAGVYVLMTLSFSAILPALFTTRRASKRARLTHTS